MVKNKWDLSQIYNSQEDFDNDFTIVSKLLVELEGFKGKLILKDKEILKQFFDIESKYYSILEKLIVYARCKNDDNGKDDTNVRNYALINNFYSSSSEKLAFVNYEITSLDEEFLNEIKEEKNFEDYSRDIEKYINFKKHSLTEKEEAILATVSGFSNTDDIYSTISDVEMYHGEIEDENGETIKLSHSTYNYLLCNKTDQDFRQKVQDIYLNEYGRFNLTIANLYISHIKYANFIAKLRGFKSLLDDETTSEEVSTEIMLKNIEYVGKNTTLLKDYFNLKKNILGLNEFYSSDIAFTLPFKTEKITFEDCIDDIRASYAPLGIDYQEMFDKALNEGWIDALPREHKASGGYTIHTYLIHPYILLNFDGTETWKSAISHEFGHAMHAYYSCQSQPYSKSSYTIFVAEVASLTNEILLSKYLLEKETDKKQKMKILSEFLALFNLNVFNASMLAEFELYAHNEIWNGETITANNLNNKYIELSKKYYGESVKLTKNYQYDWERKSHIFRDYYLYKYSTGLISACAVASKILSDKTGEYVKKYKQFLSLGNSLKPIESLKIAEIDITKEETYSFAFDMYKDYLNKLKKLYEENL